MKKIFSVLFLLFLCFALTLTCSASTINGDAIDNLSRFLSPSYISYYQDMPNGIEFTMSLDDLYSSNTSCEIWDNTYEFNTVYGTTYFPSTELYFSFIEPEYSFTDPKIYFPSLSIIDLTKLNTPIEISLDYDDPSTNCEVVAWVSLSYYGSNGELMGTSQPVRTDLFNGDVADGFSFSLSQLIPDNMPNDIKETVTISFYLEFYPYDNLEFTGINIYTKRIIDYGLKYGEYQPPIIEDNSTTIIEQINPNVIEWLVESLNSFFSVQIFGDITIGNIFGIALAVPIVIWFLKLFAGG